jgi:hypothetical protein
MHSAVVPLNFNEIAIFGGIMYDSILASMRSDIIIFDTKTEKCRKVADTGEFKFIVCANQAVHVGPGRVRILAN